MRKIPLSMIKPEMKLAKPIYHKNRLLVTNGTVNIDRFVTTLVKLGIFYVYVDDIICENIDIPDIISDQTRLKCKLALFRTLDKLKTEGMLNIEPLFEMIDVLLTEIMNRPDILICLNDIGSTDESTLVHSVNTTVYALLIGGHLGYSNNDLRRLAEGTLLHDIGKTLVKQAILQKPGALTTTEFDHIKTHTTLGNKLLKKNPLLTELTRIIALNHHERLDGSGYPNGLQRKEIHEFVRIVSIADVYESLTAERCYHRSICPFDAIQIITKDSANKLDAYLAALLIRSIAIYPNGSTVQLSDRRYAIVKEQNQGMPFCPIVRILGFEDGREVSLGECNLMDELTLTITESNVTNYSSLREKSVHKRF